MLTFLCLGFSIEAQKTKPKTTSAEITIPLTQDRWDFKPGSAEFITYKNKPAIKLLNGNDKLIPKGIEFTNGTIEYDTEPHPDEFFTGIYFRMESDDETEYFYLRPPNAGKYNMNVAQYACYLKGVNLWDMLPYYEGPAKFKKGEWNHIKLVVSGMQMLVYVNDMTTPSLEIPRLEGNTKSGRIAFNGRSTISNIVIKPDVVEGLPSREGFDPTNRDTRYIREWQMTEPKPLPQGRELYNADFPTLDLSWQTISAERRGLINLTRFYGVSDRRYVWLRVRVVSSVSQKKKIALGLSDEVWVFVNRQPVYVDKNIFFSQGMRKNPNGRISVENTEFEIPLNEGENELLVGIANDFYGWGIIARFEDMKDIDVDINFPPPVIPPKDLTPYVGTYQAPDFPMKFIFTIKDKALMVEATGQQAVPLEYFEKDKFRFVQSAAIFEYLLNEKKMVFKQNNNATTFTKE